MSRLSRPRVGVVALIALLTCLLGAAIITGAYDDRRAWVVGLRIAVGVISIAALCKVVFFAYTKQPSPPGKPEVRKPTKREIAQAYYNIKHNYAPHVIGMIAKMLIDLPEYLERINEDVTLSEESPRLKIVTHQMYRIGSPRSDSRKEINSSDPLLIPVVLVRKGVLLDNFTVCDASGSLLPTLSYNQTRGLLTLVMRYIINSLPEKANGLSDEECKKRRAKAIADLGRAICFPGPRKKQDQEVQDEIDELLSSVDTLPVEETWKKRIRAFCETLVDQYVIVAEATVDAGNYVTLSYTQDIPIEQSSTVNKWRGRFGLKYSTVDIPLHTYAVRTESYHLQMNAGPMEYIFDHHLEWLRSGDAVRPGELNWGSFIPYVRIHYGSANPAAHSYIRRQSSSEEATKALRQASASKDADKSSHIDQLKSVVEFRRDSAGRIGRCNNRLACHHSYCLLFCLDPYWPRAIPRKSCNLARLGHTSSSDRAARRG